MIDEVGGEGDTDNSSALDFPSFKPMRSGKSKNYRNLKSILMPKDSGIFRNKNLSTANRRIYVSDTPSQIESDKNDLVELLMQEEKDDVMSQPQLISDERYSQSPVKQKKEVPADPIGMGQNIL